MASSRPIWRMPFQDRTSLIGASLILSLLKLPGYVRLYSKTNAWVCYCNPIFSTLNFDELDVECSRSAPSALSGHASTLDLLQPHEIRTFLNWVRGHVGPSSRGSSLEYAQIRFLSWPNSSPTATPRPDGHKFCSSYTDMPSSI